MGRRRKKSDLDLLIEAPWQRSAFLAVFGFVVLYWILPAFLQGVGAALAPAFRVLALLAFAMFGMAAVAAFVRARTEGPAEDRGGLAERAQSAGSIRERLRETREALRVEPAALDVAWGKNSVELQEVRAPSAWSSAVLRKMEWKRLEYLAAAYYTQLGFRAETIRCGADGGIDIRLFRGALAEPVSIVQCKAWNSRPVGVKPVRELLGVMTHNRVQTGVFLTTGTYTGEAVSFARGNKIALVAGEEFLAKIKALPAAAQASLLAVATDGDWTTPSCPSCGTKMVRRDGKSGEFWGCLSFPRCRQTFQIQKQ